MSYLSISTWSLHRLLGPLRFTVWNADTSQHGINLQEQPEVHTLLELPAEAKRRGYQALEVCHFHFPSVEPDYLEQLRLAFTAAGLSFDTLLLDYGDLTTSDEARLKADKAFFKQWIDVAASVGAKQIRIVAGEAAASDKAAMHRSAVELSEMVSYASKKGVRVITENFRPLTSTGANCVELLSEVGSELGFITDFGNFKAPHKYDEFAQTLPYSVSVHAKPHYDAEGIPDAEELIRCLETVREAEFNGAIVLIYDGPGEMWAGLERVKYIIEPYL
ncbi:xylose isomerase [Paenibacillus baekrokdamisoli]|uniref:Xylose isomerase n=1 Tax=Paenibacillus baekrokdamisoli TaxID=1712516 RepID=A0A3G9J494_9BACL|nr:TIM barrel protein [Paenibacillus baekrokdamisoli]MBB3067268.1 sugar phosphate isomerase/epimerase [Paenibacillus baekrokdamisoli]BBH19543.1 xylose isomerase [Paenibacillus baekrokdamisoli]